MNFDPEQRLGTADGPTGVFFDFAECQLRGQDMDVLSLAREGCSTWMSLVRRGDPVLKRLWNIRGSTKALPLAKRCPCSEALGGAGA